ncbi:MAG: 50S ribosomal protein L18Ae [Candidatus Bathyarchaeia archaeon]
MAEVKVFRIMGRLTMGFQKMKFVKEIRALKPEHATEKIYSELGSRHKLKRAKIEIDSIEEVTEPQLES